MKIIEYIISCIIGNFDALVGGQSNTGWKEGIIGFASLAFVILLFFGAFILLDKTTKLDFGVNILCSLGITISMICIIFGVIIIVENLFF